MPASRRAITSRVTVQNPRPRKYASAAEKQAAFRARFPTLCVRVEPKTADTVQAVADASGRTQQETLLSMLKFAMTNRNWLTLGLTEHKQLPRIEEPRKENPTMKRKPTPAQIAARERFAAMARSGAFKKKASKARSVSKKVDLQAWMDEYDRLENENMHSENVVRLADLLGTKTDQQVTRQIVKNTQRIGYLTNDDYDRQRAIYKRLMPKLERLLEPKSNPAKKTVSQKISQLTREGYPQKQAVAIALNEERAGKVKRNPIKKFIVYTETKPGNWKQVRVTENLDVAKDLAKSNAESGYPSIVEDATGAIVYTPKVASNPVKPKKQRMLNISWLTAGGQREIMSVPIDFVFTHYVGNVAERFFVRTENGQLIVSEYSTGGRIGQVPYTMRAAALNDRDAAKRYVGEMLSRIGAERFKAAVKKFDPIN